MQKMLTLNDNLEELDLSVRSYKLLRKYGCSSISDILTISLKDLWFAICNQSKNSFREILTKLDTEGFRFPECSQLDYPNIQVALPGIMQGFAKSKTKETVPQVKRNAVPLPSETINGFSSIESLINPGKSRGLFAAYADGGNHFTAYGIKEGSLLIFDRDLEQVDDYPCCYFNEDTQKMRVLKTAEVADQYVGRLVAVINLQAPA